MWILAFFRNCHFQATWCDMKKWSFLFTLLLLIGPFFDLNNNTFIFDSNLKIKPLHSWILLCVMVCECGVVNTVQILLEFARRRKFSGMIFVMQKMQTPLCFFISFNRILFWTKFLCWIQNLRYIGTFIC